MQLLKLSDRDLSAERVLRKVTVDRDALTLFPSGTRGHSPDDADKCSRAHEMLSRPGAGQATSPGAAEPWAACEKSSGPVEEPRWGGSDATGESDSVEPSPPALLPSRLPAKQTSISKVVSAPADLPVHQLNTIEWPL